MKTWNKKNIQELLDKSDKAVIRALLTIYDFQTNDEKASHTTRLHNNVGFSAYDADFLSDLAENLNSGKYRTLTPKQLAVCRNKMKRYWRQLVEVANANEQRKAADIPQEPQVVESKAESPQMTALEEELERKAAFAEEEKLGEQEAFERKMEREISGSW